MNDTLKTIGISTTTTAIIIFTGFFWWSLTCYMLMPQHVIKPAYKPAYTYEIKVPGKSIK